MRHKEEEKVTHTLCVEGYVLGNGECEVCQHLHEVTLEGGDLHRSSGVKSLLEGATKLTGSVLFSSFYCLEAPFILIPAWRPPREEIKSLPAPRICHWWWRELLMLGRRLGRLKWFA